jgi:predicted RNA-binding Zn-ribbon protein involved in translation (DUF1610 family)
MAGRDKIDSRMVEQGKDESPGVIGGDLACRGCGYNLRGLSWAGANCPECGRKLNSMVHEIQPGDVIRNLQCTGCGYNLEGLALDGACSECGESVRDSLAQTRKGQKVDKESLAGFFYGAMMSPFWFGAVVVWLICLQFSDSRLEIRIAMGLFIFSVGVMDFVPVRREGKPLLMLAGVQCVAGPGVVAATLIAGEFGGWWWMIPAVCWAIFRHAYLAQLMYGLRIYHRNERFLVVVMSSPVCLFLAGVSGMLSWVFALLIFALWALATVVMYSALWWHVINAYKRGWTRLTGNEAEADREVLIAATHEPSPKGVLGWD